MREKRDNREARIRQEAAAMIANTGFFGLRISDLAQRCELSIGTLYSHYACKEDLLIALAIDSLGSQYEAIQAAAAIGHSPIERYIASAVAALRYACREPAFAELERLAMMPSIWKRCSPRLQQQLIDDIDVVNGFFFGHLEQATVSGELVADADKQQLQWLNVGAWSLSMGLDVVAYSTFSAGRQAAAMAGEWEAVQKVNLARFLTGWGWTEPEPLAVIDRICNSVPAPCQEVAPCPSPEDPKHHE